MLYNYNKTKSEIRNIDLRLLNSEIDGVGAIVYEEKTVPINKLL